MSRFIVLLDHQEYASINTSAQHLVKWEIGTFKDYQNRKQVRSYLGRLAIAWTILANDWDLAEADDTCMTAWR